MKANYLQLWEGGLDSSHVSVLHTNQARKSWSADRGVDVDLTNWTPMDDSAPPFEVADTPFGYHYAPTRHPPPGRAEDRFRHVRHTHAHFPPGPHILCPTLTS